MGTKTLTGRLLSALPMLAALALGLCAVLAVAFGAGAYSGIVSRQSAGSGIRTADQFAAMKLRQASEWGGITIEDGAAVCTEWLSDGSVYEDILYGHEGWLMELYMPAGGETWGIDGDAGDRVLESGGVLFEDLGGGLYLYDMDVGGRRVRGAVDVRSGGRP